MIYAHKWIIDPEQYSRLRRSHIKQSCAHEIIHLNNMQALNTQPNLFKTIYTFILMKWYTFNTIYFWNSLSSTELKHVMCLYTYVCTHYYHLSCVLTTRFMLHGLDFLLHYCFKHPWMKLLKGLLDNIILFIHIESTFALSSCFGDFQYNKIWINKWRTLFPPIKQTEVFSGASSCATWVHTPSQA